MRNRHERGFTLIEILITLFIVTVGILALSRFTVAIMGSGQVASERMTAVHLAEQVLEFWQHDTNDLPPKIAPKGCVLTAGGSAPSTTVCKSAMGVKSNYTIYVNELPATGPLKDTTWGGFGRGTFRGAAPPFKTKPLPKTQLVRVTWIQKGVSHQIYLTHISRPQ